MAGKGDKKRPTDEKAFGDSYRRIFGEKPKFTGTTKLKSDSEEEKVGSSPEMLFRGSHWPSKHQDMRERQRVALEKDPLHITLQDKREKAFETQEHNTRKLLEIAKMKSKQVSDV